MNILPEFLLPLQKHHDLFMNWAGDMKKNHRETNCQKKYLRKQLLQFVAGAIDEMLLSSQWI